MVTAYFYIEAHLMWECTCGQRWPAEGTDSRLDDPHNLEPVQAHEKNCQQGVVRISGIPDKRLSLRIFPSVELVPETL